MAQQNGLTCKHCGVENSYADAHISDINDADCPAAHADGHEWTEQ